MANRVDELAQLIAEGDRMEALRLLKDLCPDQLLVPETYLRLAELRRTAPPLRLGPSK